MPRNAKNCSRGGLWIGWGAADPHTPPRKIRQAYLGDCLAGQDMEKRWTCLFCAVVLLEYLGKSWEKISETSGGIDANDHCFIIRIVKRTAGKLCEKNCRKALD